MSKSTFTLLFLALLAALIYFVATSLHVIVAAMTNPAALVVGILIIGGIGYLIYRGVGRLFRSFRG